VIDIDSNNKPDVYWNPKDGVISTVSLLDVDYDGEEEILLDTDNNGKFDLYWEDGNVLEFIDLSISVVQVEPENLFTGSDAEITVLVSNSGNYDVKGVRVNFLVDDRVMYSESTDVLKNSSSMINFVWENCKVGIHELIFQVDPNNVILERNEGNNVDKVEVRIRTHVRWGKRTTSTTVPQETGKAYFEDLPKELNVPVGDMESVTLKFVNEFNHELRDVKFSIEGVEWYDIYPESYGVVESNETITLSVKFRPTQSGTFDVKLKAISNSDYGEKIIEKPLVVEAGEIQEEMKETKVEEEKSPITGFVVMIQKFALLLVVIAFLILILLLRVRFKVKWSKGYAFSPSNVNSYIEVKIPKSRKVESVEKTLVKNQKKVNDIRLRLIEELRKKALREGEKYRSR
ncbi:MAG TPA: hypothetical protein ENG34_00090, partial [Candidatus Aenigmarchaeota archaeon]|nr:hypothetical protein [Candidatus Aenigmarchaeota archaeon]